MKKIKKKSKESMQGKKPWQRKLHQIPMNGREWLACPTHYAGIPST